MWGQPPPSAVHRAEGPTSRCIARRSPLTFFLTFGLPFDFSNSGGPFQKIIMVVTDQAGSGAPAAKPSSLALGHPEKMCAPQFELT